MLPIELLALVSVLQSPATRIDAPPPQGTRTVAPTSRQLLEAELAHLPLPELLRRQPSSPWDRANEGKLLPLVTELLRRAGSGTWTDDDWRTALTVTDMIHTRTRWPAGEPLEIGIGSQGWLRLSKIVVRAVEPSLGEVAFDDLHPAMCGNCAQGHIDRAQHSRLGPLPPDTTRVVFEVTVIQSDEPEELWPRSKTNRLLWKGRLERPIQAVATAADVVPATNSGSETTAIRKSLRAFWSTATADPDELVLAIYTTYVHQPALRGLGVSLSVELWNAEKLVHSKDLVAQKRRTWGDGFDECSGSASMPGLLATLRIPNADLSKWELRVRGNPANVPGIWDAERWWNGSFSMPLTEAFGNNN